MTLHRRGGVWLLLLGAAAGLVASAPDPASEPPQFPTASELPTRTANVVEVLDGDSLMVLLDGELRRLEVLGADAPEWRSQNPEPSPQAFVSRRFLMRLLENERVAIHEPSLGALDKVGRRMGYVFRMPDGLPVDLEIVRQGYGRVSTRAADPFREPLRFYEQRARELDRGIWGTAQELASDEPGGGDPEPVKPSPDGSADEPEESGDAESDQPPEAERESEWVWVTRSGARYHREGCQHLKSSRTRVRRAELDPQLTPCKTCDPDG